MTNRSCKLLFLLTKQKQKTSNNKYAPPIKTKTRTKKAEKPLFFNMENIFLFSKVAYFYSTVGNTDPCPIKIDFIWYHYASQNIQV